MKYPNSSRAKLLGGRRAGLALVELMIALVLGLVIVAALGQLYAGGRSTARVGESLTRLNENGRFAVDLLAGDLRMAGYLSCGGAGAELGNAVNGGGNWLYQTAGLRGFEGGVDTLPSELTGKVRSGTDVLIVRRAAAESAAAGQTFQRGDVLVISNTACNQATLFQLTAELAYNPSVAFNPGSAVSTTGSNPGNCTANLFGSFDCGSVAAAYADTFGSGFALSRYAVHAYYVSASDPPTLMRMQLCEQSGTAATCLDELIRDVEDLQVEYCCDGNAYVTADQVIARGIDWGDLTSVRFALLLRSRNANVRTEASAQTISLLETPITTPSDRYLRRVFGGVVATRNQLP
jgi:type IV pilus assembly protein PilW